MGSPILKKTLYFLFLVICSVIFTLSCNPTEVSPSSTVSTPTGATNQPQGTSIPRPPIWLDLNISTLPILSENVELSFTVDIEKLWNGEWEGRKTEDLADSRAWVQFFWADMHGSYTAARKFVEVPLSDISSSGELSWEGNALENRNITLKGNIQIPREGVWRIIGYFSTANWEQPTERWLQFPETGLKTPLPTWKQYAVADGTAVRMFFGDYKNSSLGYLFNFDYGMVADKTLYDPTALVIIQLDISKPPLVGEEVNLTCTIASLYDEPDFSAKITFLKSPGIKTDIPLSEFLVNGDLAWEGDLKSQTPVTFSAVIKFPEEGEWQIYAFGNSLERENAQFSGFAGGIMITIAEDKTYYGWEEIKPVGTTPPSVTGITTTPPFTTIPSE